MKFNSKIQPGDPVLVIGCQTKNGEKFLGMILTAEYLCKAEDPIPKVFFKPDTAPNVTKIASEDMWVCSGVEEADQKGGWAVNYAAFAPKHLMPLPPLPEVESTEDLGKEKELEPC